MKPATPLPWKTEELAGFFSVSTGGKHACSTSNREDADYISHACNAYPKLVEALVKVVLNCDENSTTHKAHDLLKELGELK